MADWPTLIQAKTSLPITEQPLLDPTIRSTKEDGTVTTRLRFPAVPRQWSFQLRWINEADRTALKTFEHTTVSYGSGTFNWLNPIDNAIYVVRLGAPFAFTHDGVGGIYQTPVTLIEATATQ